MNCILPTVRKRAVITFADGAEIDCLVILQTISASGSEETLCGMLNSDRNFFAAIIGEEVRFLHKKSVAICIQPDLAGDAAPGAPFVPCKKEHMVLTLAGGRTLEGTVSIQMPERHSRVIDFLNDAQGFISMDTGKGQCLINVSMVRQVAIASADSHAEDTAGGENG